jgi:acyl-CoA reductase-like NAD-dependent aldehyde dehydrogenase
MPLRVVSPFTQEVVLEVPWDAPSDVGKKLDRARAAHRRWKAIPVEERIAHLAKAAESFSVNGSQIARDISLQMGKPVLQARREVDTMLARIAHLLAIGKFALATETLPAPKGMTLRIEHKPLGVVLDIAAWNYPLLVPVNVVVPALVAGNAVILKHSPLTPLCGTHFERAFAALPVQGLVQNLVVENERAESIIGDPSRRSR